jgi:ECF sigma factor
MPSTRIAAGVRDNLIAALLAQRVGDREVEARLTPRIYRRMRRPADRLFSEIALILHVSCRTRKRDWSMATTWLKRELSVQP